MIQNVKVDFVRYFYKEIRSIRKINGLRLASIEDIAAMKLAAITGRGRKRDFIDLFFLLKKYSLKKMLEFYKKKYPDGNELMVMRSLLYFEDAENDTMPNLLREDEIQWADIKNFINQEVRRMAIKL